MNDSVPRPFDVLWACVEDGFHVGSRGGDFLGYVDRQSDGTYIAFDARSRSIGSFQTLTEATSAVSASDPTASVATDLIDGSDTGLTGAVQQ